MVSALSMRYARAFVDVLFEGRGERSDPRLAVTELRAFQTALQASPELRNVMSSPAVSAARKRAVAERLGRQLGVSRLVRNFLNVLIEHRRMAQMQDLPNSVESLIDQRLGIAQVAVASAQELNDSQRHTLEGELGRLTGRQVRVNYQVQPELLGGVVARIGSTVYDGSIRGRLESLREQLVK